MVAGCLRAGGRVTDETPETPGEKRTRRRRAQLWYAELFREMPDDFTPLEAVAAVKCLDSTGEVCLFTAKTAGLAVWDAYGILQFAAHDFSPAMLDACSTEDDE